ncbi:MAG TPA: ribokinase [Ktedonobacteraceae bacterium]|nr:ribokinase [Ktedonobacteraceae bacterium]
MANNTILVIGSLNMDQIVQVSRLPMLGETLLTASSLRIAPGGKGANQAVAMARLGASVTLAGRVGNDPFGVQLLRSLKADNVETGMVVIDQEASSGIALIFLTPEGNNAIVVASGANMRVGQDQAELAHYFAAISQTRALVLQLEIPLETVTTLITAGHTSGIPVVLNLAPAQLLPWEILKQVEVLVANEQEAGLLCGQQVDNMEDAGTVATLLHQQGIATVAITLGAQGALLVTGDGVGGTRSIYQPAPKVQVLDTTAAGDCFVGALTVALTEGQTPEQALRFAVYASALKVTKFGAQPGLPTRAEVEAFKQP